MEALEIIGVIFMAGWFAAIGASRRTRPIMVPIWALFGVFIAVVGFYIAAWIVEQILLAAGPAIAPNGVFVVSSLAGIAGGIGLCYLLYLFITRRERAVAATPSAPSVTR
jgi:hypothetical protein